MTETRRLDAITIGPRFRRDMGDIRSLAESIEQVGLLQPIVVTPDGRLIAGERRFRACWALGWEEIPVRVVNLENLTAGEVAENFERKNFLPSEIEAIRRAHADKVATPIGRPSLKMVETFHHLDPGKTRDKIAVLAKVSGRTVEKIAAVVAAAEAEPERFGKLVEVMDRTGRVDRAHKMLRIARDREAYEARREKGGTIADLQALAATGYRAGVIYPDPPWLYTMLGPGGKVHTSAENHYDTMTIERLCDMGPIIRDLAADDCALFLWVAWPLLLPNRYQEGVGKIIEAWGFEYKTLGFLWEKIIPDNEKEDDEERLFWGNGFWTRANSEPCLLATRGSPKRLAMDVHQVVRAPRGEHSEKPVEVHERIERLVAGPYLELFARKPRAGWVTWGDEVPKLAAE